MLLVLLPLLCCFQLTKTSLSSNEVPPTNIRDRSETYSAEWYQRREYQQVSARDVFELTGWTEPIKYVDWTGYGKLLVQPPYPKCNLNRNLKPKYYKVTVKARLQDLQTIEATYCKRSVRETSCTVYFWGPVVRSERLTPGLISAEDCQALATQFDSLKGEVNGNCKLVVEGQEAECAWTGTHVSNVVNTVICPHFPMQLDINDMSVTGAFNRNKSVAYREKTYYSPTGEVLSWAYDPSIKSTCGVTDLFSTRCSSPDKRQFLCPTLHIQMNLLPENQWMVCNGKKIKVSDTGHLLDVDEPIYTDYTPKGDQDHQFRHVSNQAYKLKHPDFIEDELNFWATTRSISSDQSEIINYIECRLLQKNWLMAQAQLRSNPLGAARAMFGDAYLEGRWVGDVFVSYPVSFIHKYQFMKNENRTENWPVKFRPGNETSAWQLGYLSLKDKTIVPYPGRTLAVHEQELFLSTSSLVVNLLNSDAAFKRHVVYHKSTGSANEIHFHHRFGPSVHTDYQTMDYEERIVGVENLLQSLIRTEGLKPSGHDLKMSLKDSASFPQASHVGLGFLDYLPSVVRDFFGVILLILILVVSLYTLRFLAVCLPGCLPRCTSSEKATDRNRGRLIR